MMREGVASRAESVVGGIDTNIMVQKTVECWCEPIPLTARSLSSPGSNPF